MISVTTINKSKPRSILFIHGLFATAGFWLPYIKFFCGYRLDFVNVDFISSAQQLDDELEELTVSVSKLFPTAIVCHSLGCALGRYIKHPNTYFICDVSNALPSNTHKFSEAIAGMSGKDIPSVQVGLDVAELYHQRIRNTRFRSDNSFTPDNDEFFAYVQKPNFCGTHFEIAKAVKTVSELLNDS